MLFNALMEYVVALYNFSKGLVLWGYSVFGFPISWGNLMIIWLFLSVLGLVIYESL